MFLWGQADGERVLVDEKSGGRIKRNKENESTADAERAKGQANIHTQCQRHGLGGSTQGSPTGS